MDGKRFAIIDFPEPGGPTIIRLCPPAAATSALFSRSPDREHRHNRIHNVSGFRKIPCRVSTIVGEGLLLSLMVV